MTDTLNFTPTYMRWYNSAKGAKVMCHQGKVEKLPYGSTSTREFHANDRPPHPQFGQFQWGLACSPESRTIVDDGDYPDQWGKTAAGKLLGDWRDVATSVRDCGDGTVKFHVAEIVPLELVHLWPKRKPVAYGHIISNGLCYVEGMHASGTEYLATGKNWVVATEALMRAHLEDNGGCLHTDHGTASADDIDDDADGWEDPDASYSSVMAEDVLGNWVVEHRNESLVARCGIIKGAGDNGTKGMRTLFSDLCAEYDIETGRGDSDVYRAYARCFPAWGKARSAAADTEVPPDWQPIIDARTAKIAANGHVPLQEGSVEDTGAVEDDAAGEPAGEPGLWFDTSNAHDDQELADACLYAAGNWVRYAADAELWLTPERECWVSTAGDLTPWIITKLADSMPFGISAKQAEADGLDHGDPQVKAELTRFTNRVTCRSGKDAGRIAGKMRSRLTVAGHHQITLRLADLDADPAIIWAGGTPWDIRASREKLTAAELDPGTPHLKSARYCPAVVATPLWDAYLAAVWPEKDIREWALKQAAQAVTGYSEKAFPVLSGETDTGKTQFVVMVCDVLGRYAATVSPDLLSGSGTALDYARFELLGIRLGFVDEAPRTGKLAQAALKNLTGGGDIHGRPPYGKPVTFAPTHTVIATANPGSDPPLTDSAVAERIRLIPCDGDPAAVRTAREAIGPLDGKAWRAEAPGVLASLIIRAAGALSGRALHNEDAPLAVQLRAGEMAAEQDSVGRWLTTMTEPAKAGQGWAGWTASSPLHGYYVAWCRNHDEKPETQVEWGRRMSKLGRPPEHRRDGGWYPVSVGSYAAYGG